LAVVRRDIDRVLDLADVGALVEWAGDIWHSPESRMLAARLVEAVWNAAVAEREVRPPVDLPKVRASVPGLNSRKWRDRRYYGSLLDVPPAPGTPPERQPALREQPLED
jgi:hypothetical protein